MTIQTSIPTYIINIKTSTARHQYMVDLLKDYSFLNIKFVDAVDGRILSDTELNRMFDSEASYKKYGRKLNKGEIGCTLSHIKCYEKLIESDDIFALILEDDISIINDINILKDKRTEQLLIRETPTVILLSGDYWYYKAGSICEVFSAVGGYSFIINKTAAKLLLADNPAFTVADDWDYIRSRGIKLYAFKPYLVDANLNMDQLSSDIKQEYWGAKKSKMSLKFLMKHLYCQLIKLFLFKINHFESKVRVINNKPVLK